MPSPPGIQPFEWGVICVLFGSFVSLIIYVWNDAKKRDAQDKSEMREMVSNFSARVDRAFQDLQTRLQQQGERMAVLANSQVHADKQMTDLQADVHNLDVSFVRTAEQIAMMRGRLGLSSPSGGIPAYRQGQ